MMGPVVDNTNAGVTMTDLVADATVTPTTMGLEADVMAKAMMMVPEAAAIVSLQP